MEWQAFSSSLVLWMDLGLLELEQSLLVEEVVRAELCLMSEMTERLIVRIQVKEQSSH
jgi:hypothetical protein